MVAEPRTWVDVPAAVRAWARVSLPAMAGAIGLGIVKDAQGKDVMPQIALRRIAGPDDRCLFQFDCWASKGQGQIAATQVSTQLCTAIDALSRYVHNGTVLKGAVIEDVRWEPDTESDQPRVIVDATFFAMAGS